MERSFVLDVYKRQACNKEKGHAQVALSYTLGDAYTLDYWMEMAKRVEDMGADSLCIKDMAGLLVPQKATELIQALKSSTSLPIELHTHYTSGVASMTYMKDVYKRQVILLLQISRAQRPASLIWQVPKKKSDVYKRQGQTDAIWHNRGILTELWCAFHR